MPGAPPRPPGNVLLVLEEKAFSSNEAATPSQHQGHLSQYLFCVSILLNSFLGKLYIPSAIYNRQQPDQGMNERTARSGFSSRTP